LTFLLRCCVHPRDLHSFPTRRSSDLSFGGIRDGPRQEPKRTAPTAGALFVRATGGCPTGDIDLCVLSCTSWRWGRRAACSATATDRKSTRLNSSHLVISYAVFCLKKK